jgi:hypothetical protein
MDIPAGFMSATINAFEANNFNQPGYFWFVNDGRNLLPICDGGNVANRDGSGTPFDGVDNRYSP